MLTVKTVQFPRDIARNRALARVPIGAGLARAPQTQPNGMPQTPRGLTFSFTVTSAGGLLLPIDFDRQQLFIQNNDTLGVVWLAIGAPAAIGFGFKLAAGGGGLLLDYGCPTAQVNAIGTILSNPNIMVITA